MSQPLSGIHVLDFGHFVAGPFSGTVLGDLGSEVVKVEPFGGDPIRSQASASFAGANRGKRSIAVDLKSADGAKIIASACEWADIVIHNFRPGVAQRLGIDAPTLLVRKPELVVLELSAYGSRGPKAPLPRFDTLMQAYTGHFVQAGGQDNPPLAYRFSHVDHASGMLGALGVIAALYHRRRSGRGALVSVSLLSTALFMLSELVRDEEGRFHGLSPLDGDQLGNHPAESLYKASDGWLAIVALDESGTQKLAGLFGLREITDRPRAEWGDFERNLLAEAVARASVDENLSALRGAGIWAERCEDRGLKALTEDPAMVDAGMTLVSDDSDYGRRAEIGRAASFARLSSTSATGRSRVPTVGQHTSEVLSEFGYTKAEIEEMYGRESIK
jgi:crotonobetainyl-CoA:carnitine CoA-transferase CaiB-like acyl-CoA transferase